MGIWKAVILYICEKFSENEIAKTVQTYVMDPFS